MHCRPFVIGNVWDASSSLRGSTSSFSNGTIGDPITHINFKNLIEFSKIGSLAHVGASLGCGLLVFMLHYNTFLQSTVPRLGRVCKDDPGTLHRQSSKWTTFLKASLDCANPGETPFHFDSLESVAYLPSEEIFYGLFSTQR